MRPARPRVLIVDDQAPNIDVLAEALGEGYELFAATSAERAIELAASGMDLILLDVVMPEQNGFDLCRALKAREKTRAIPVIFVTALGEVEDEARGFEAGGVDYITKPISPPTVRARARTHLELRGAQKRLEKEAEVLAENLRLKEHVERLSRHDLKTPLTSVISIPQILLDAPGLTDEQASMLRSVEAAGYRILDMVNRSLDLFRMESGTYEFHPAGVDLGELAERVALDLKPLARERDVAFDLPAVRGEAATAKAEELLSYSMLANLVKNAVEASPRGGVVRIQVDTHDTFVRLAVRNPGAVPLALREAFFRKYASSGKKSGTGLGTYSARLMAETQHGHIEMSTSDESGTVVTVSLERAGVPSSTDSEGGAQSESRTEARPGQRVLIADDDEPTRFVLARFIGEAATVAFARDGDEAIVQVGTFDPTVVILDAEMPGLDGPATATRLRAADVASGRPRRRLIGLSAHDDAAMREAFLGAGCDLVLVKPVTRAAILEAVWACDPMSERASEDVPDASEVVGVEADLLPMIPAFLQSRREQARDLAAALDDEALERARGLAHKLRGGLEMCGFMKAGALSRTIEDHLTSGRPAREIADQVRILRDYLDHVRYEPRPTNP
jgi:CheY-like chemotaxis protein/HPt (histidine-containing phosphotransfer) domain-containing protein